MKRKLLQFMFAGMCAFTIMASPALSVHAEEGDERAAEEAVSEEFVDDLGEETPAEEAPVEEEANDEAPVEEEANEEAERLEESATDDDETPVEAISSNAVSADDDANDAAYYGWNKDTKGWWYQRSNGTYPANCWEKIGYYWYHFNASGYRDENKWIGNCYVLEDGRMATSQWVDGDKFWVDSQGNWVKGKYKEGWMDSASGRWYQNADGSYPKSTWKQIDGYWYYFNGSGYMLKNTWVGNYYVGSDGRMATKTWVDKKYYVDKSGNWVHGGWAQIYGTIYVNGDSRYAYDEWYYFDANGVILTNKWIGSYFVDQYGRMCTSKWVDNDKYYVGEDGIYVKNCWKQRSGYWYHLGAYGDVDKNKWIGSSWVGADGKKAINAWVDSDKYYVDKDGVKATNTWVYKGSDKVHLNANGLIDKNKWVDEIWVGAKGAKVTYAWVDSNKYYTNNAGNKEINNWVSFYHENYYIGTKKIYAQNTMRVHFNADGKIDANKWIKDGNKTIWVRADGTHASSEWVNGNKYYVNSDGTKFINDFKWFYNSNVYYLPGSTTALYGTSSGVKVYFDTKGQIVAGKWIEYDGYKYYANSKGALYRNGWYTIGGKDYYFDSLGRWDSSKKK